MRLREFMSTGWSKQSNLMEYFQEIFCIKCRSDNTVFEKGFGRLMKSDVNSVLWPCFNSDCRKKISIHVVESFFDYKEFNWRKHSCLNFESNTWCLQFSCYYLEPFYFADFAVFEIYWPEDLAETSQKSQISFDLCQTAEGHLEIQSNFLHFWPQADLSVAPWLGSHIFEVLGQ